MRLQNILVEGKCLSVSAKLRLRYENNTLLLSFLALVFNVSLFYCKQNLSNICFRMSNIDKIKTDRGLESFEMLELAAEEVLLRKYHIENLQFHICCAI
jgi:hypothetical protein